MSTRTPLERCFYDWLGEQRSRQDEIGRFARGALADTQFPRELSSEGDLVSYLEGHGTHQDAVEIAREAWEEFGDSATAFTDPDEIVRWDDDDDERRV